MPVLCKQNKNRSPRSEVVTLSHVVNQTPAAVVKGYRGVLKLSSHCLYERAMTSVGQTQVHKTTSKVRYREVGSPVHVRRPVEVILSISMWVIVCKVRIQSYNLLQKKEFK